MALFFNDEYNKLARTISRVSEVLDKLTDVIPINLLVTHSERQLLQIAYVCKVGIVDRIDKNNWDLKKPISIPTGIFSSKMMTIEKGLEITVLKLAEIACNDIELKDKMTEIFDKEELFYEIERELPNDWKQMMK